MSANPNGSFSAQQGAAFFDLDKTVIARAAMSAFRGPLYEGGLLTRRALVRAIFAQGVYLHLGASDKVLTHVRTSVLKLAEGWPREKVQAVVDEALERIVEPIIYAEAMDLIDHHRAAGRRVVIVSASPEEIVQPLGRHLGVTETIASSAAVDDKGRYTGEMQRYVYGEAKGTAVRHYAETEGIDLLSSYAYSDSISDTSMLEAVGNPVVVNPDRELLSLARERGWEIRRFVRPVRLRDRMFEHVKRPARKSVLASGAALGVGSLAAVLTWWVGKRHGRPETTLIVSTESRTNSRRGPQLPRIRRAATTPRPASTAKISSFFTIIQVLLDLSRT